MSAGNEDDEYARRIASQIAQYADTVDMHALPNIFHIWTHEYYGPGFREVFGVSSVEEAYVAAYFEARRSQNNTRGRLLSVGCGDGSIEISIAKRLLAQGEIDFTFVCADLSPIFVTRLNKNIKSQGLSEYVESVEADLNNIAIPGMFDVIIANHALHHFEGLENLFSYSLEHLTDQGIFATSDVIGRNGHMRWPETAAILQAIWPTLSPKQRYHTLLTRLDENFTDHDCSTEGFEGIRAQDILPLMLKYFKPYKFFGTGGFIDLLIDRGYGHGFDINSDADKAAVRMIADLNEIMLDAGLVKPTLMTAYFTKDNRGEWFYRDRRAISSVRDVGVDPSWTRFHTKHTGS